MVDVTAGLGGLVGFSYLWLWMWMWMWMGTGDRNASPKEARSMKEA